MLNLALSENTADQLDPGIFSEHVRKEIFEHAMRAARDSQESVEHDQQEKKTFKIHQNRIRIEFYLTPPKNIFCPMGKDWSVREYQFR